MYHRKMILVLLTILVARIGLTPAADHHEKIEHEVVVQGSPVGVFDFWLNEKDAKEFFVSDARIDPYVGGRYVMIFEPATDPEGKDFGTYGAKILYMERGKRLVFEWKGPEWATEMNVRPFPMKVEVVFNPIGREVNQTKVHLVHTGFGNGENWERTYELFNPAWLKVLNRLQAYCVTKYDSDSINQHDNKNRKSTERILRKEMVVHASIKQVWDAWTTPEGIASFFAPQADIDLRLGGKYELYIKPDNAEGSRGTEGCKILSYEPYEMLSFEWNAPPKVDSLRNAGVRIPVVIRFKELAQDRVKVSLTQIGWGEGDDWDQCYAYFDRAWPHVLENLVQHFSSCGERVATRKNARTNGKLFAAIYVTGPNCIEGKPANEQPLFEQHYHHIQQAMRTGIVLAAAPFDGLTGGLVLLRTDTFEEAFEYFLKANPSYLNQLPEKIAGKTPETVTTRYLRQEIMVSASPEDIWRAWTTREGMESWMVAHAQIELKVGGIMRTNYHRDGVIGDPDTIENTILSYEPNRMLSIKATKLPADFPFKKAIQTVWTVISLEPISPHQTRVITTGLGYGEDEESQKLLTYFRRGNGWTLKQLQTRFTNSN